MLDVHPAHHAATTWRDFFIHLVTIVIGLLIAVGLEQVVEHFHHNNQVVEVRRELVDERAENHERHSINVAYFRRTRAQLRNNLFVLRFLKQHPGTTANALPGVISCDQEWAIVMDEVWRGAQQSGILMYMPQPEVQQNGRLYSTLSGAHTQQGEVSDALMAACQDLATDPDPTHLSPQELENTTERMKAVEPKIADWGTYLVDLHLIFPDFKEVPTPDELRAFSLSEAERVPALANAAMLTRHRLDADAPDPTARMRAR